MPIDYLGFQIPDEFVVGYGLDYAERYRNLPYIAVVKDRVLVHSGASQLLSFFSSVNLCVSW